MVKTRSKPHLPLWPTLYFLFLFSLFLSPFYSRKRKEKVCGGWCQVSRDEWGCGECHGLPRHPGIHMTLWVKEHPQKNNWKKGCLCRQYDLFFPFLMCSCVKEQSDLLKQILFYYHLLNKCLNKISSRKCNPWKLRNNHLPRSGSLQPRPVSVYNLIWNAVPRIRCCCMLLIQLTEWGLDKQRSKQPEKEVTATVLTI